MRGVSIATHQFAAIAESQLASLLEASPEKISGKFNQVRMMSSSARAYSRVVLRLRAQAEAEATRRRKPSTPDAPPSSFARSTSHNPRSRAPSPSPSLFSHGHGDEPNQPPASSGNTYRFVSPLYKNRQAPLLRVFVPSPEGSWMSDATIMECEKEVKRAGILGLIRAGDVVWNTAVGDEGNVGELPVYICRRETRS